MRPELSILIPTYNHNAFSLVETLSQQAELLDLNYEILLYDDGSSEEKDLNSKVIKFSNTTYKYFEENSGRTSTRRQLATDASFKWLLLLDADVTPQNDDFLKLYLEAIDEKWDAICGGVIYAESAPSASRMLRYRYGKERESVIASTRNNHPFFILTGNLLIKKPLFIAITQDMDDFYGEDLLISQRLQRKNAATLHIDNQIVHQGIEESDVYLKKAEEVLQNIVRLEKLGEMDSDFTRLQQKYSSLKRSGILVLANTFTSIFKNYIAKNLISANPSLKYFDLYRLKYYSDLKKNA